MKKKILLLISMLAVSFVLAGCGDEEELFDYDAQEAANYCVTESGKYISISADEQTYEYFLNEDASITGITDGGISAIKAFNSMINDFGQFVGYGDAYEIEEYDDSIIVAIEAECEDADVIIKMTLIDNSYEYDYLLDAYMKSYDADESTAASALRELGVYPFKLSECEVSEDQTTGELLKDAGVNTIIGMATVFLVLIFIAFVISLLKYAPGIVSFFNIKERRARRKTADNSDEEMEDTDESDEETVTNNIVSVTDAETGESMMDNSELVAVIAAAVSTYSADSQPVYVNYPSNDKLIVRPRRRR